MNDISPNTGWYSDKAATFGDRIAAAREADGTTQGELAARLGIKEKTIRSWENNMSEPRANKLQMLAGLLNVSMRWLLTGEGNGVTPPDETLTVGPDVVTLLAEMRDLRDQTVKLGDTIGQLEKRLRAALAG